MEFTNEELFLMRIYNAGTRWGTFDEINGVRQYLDEDADIMETVVSVLSKLLAISDEEFRALDLEMKKLM
ncbi:MAG: hypothetical protein IKR95_00720 [Oscillospiraceae bacterium]|nr:hypothetical protein [Oscillospiraceae bacterium]